MRAGLDILMNMVRGWLAERRIARAKALLANPNLSLIDIAQMVGYSGQSTFGEAFRRATGVTPGRYRRGL